MVCTLLGLFSPINPTNQGQLAVITAHNVLMVQTQLSMSPEVSFFTSPVPVHVAAMIIIFATISKVETLAWGLAKEDVALALKLVPLFRWRWQRQDDQSSHPLILRLANKVYGEMEIEQGPLSPPMLLDEMYWLSDTILGSDTPPRIEDVWNQPQPGTQGSQPLPVGLGGDHHEQKLAQKPQATLREQEAQFVAATEATSASGGVVTLGSSMDIDRPAHGDDDPDNYDVEGVENLLTNLSDDQGSPQTALSGRNGNGSAFLPGAGVQKNAAADGGEYYDVWSKRAGEVGAPGAVGANGAAGGSGAV